MRAYIFSGGEICHKYIEERPEEGDFVIAADGGYRNAALMNVHVNLLVGDFDSLGQIPDDVDDVLQVPAEKNETDTQLAVRLALEKGANDLVILASTSGRVDHAISVLAILEDLWEKKIPAHIVNGQNRVRFIRNSGTILVRSQYRYFSVLAADDKIKGVSIEGGKYPLANRTILRKDQFAVSNEITKNAALITVKKGGAYIIESRDL